MSQRLVLASLVEAQQELGMPASGDPAGAPEVARRLHEAGAKAVCLVDVHTLGRQSLSWLETEHARGWLALEPSAGAQPVDRDAFAGRFAAASSEGFVAADAAVLALMAATGSSRLPLLSWGEQATFAPPAAPARRPLDLYAIVESAQRIEQVLDAGLRTVQLRMKTPEHPGAGWQATLHREVQRSIDLCAARGAELFVNDHWQLAIELGARGVHLGQEDLLGLGESGRDALRRSGVAVGISSHSLWELCRARAFGPRYIACGPVWPTLTKAMPWRPQGLDNLSWWCRMAGAPVVAIGGILGAQQVREAASCGADGVCIVRGLGKHPERVLPGLEAALAQGRAEAAGASAPHAAWPHPSLAAA